MPTLNSAGDALLMTNQDQALRELQAWIDGHPDDVGGYYCRAVLETAKGMYDKALHDYRIAIALHPTDPSLYFNAGSVALQAGDLETAEAMFLKAREFDPECEGAHYYLARIYKDQGRRSEALALARRALALRPTDCSIGVADFLQLINELDPEEN